MTSFPFPRWLCPFIIFYRNAQPCLRYVIVVPYFWLWFSKHIRLGTTSRQEDTHRVPGHPFEGQGHYDSQTSQYFQCNSYECFPCEDFLLHIPLIYEKRELHVKLWVKRSKGQPTSDFLGALIFWQDIWTHLGQFFFLLCTQIQNDEKHDKKVLGQTVIDQGQ